MRKNNQDMSYEEHRVYHVSGHYGPMNNNRDGYYQPPYGYPQDDSGSLGLSFIPSIIIVALMFAIVFCVVKPLMENNNAQNNTAIVSDEENTTSPPDKTKATDDDKAETAPTTAVQTAAGYDTSAASPDFVFYQKARECRVNTDTIEINLRSSPSTNAEVIECIPNGTPVYECGSNYAWSLISYNNGQTTCYGYVSKQYLTYPGKTVDVFPCNRNGTINASKGEVSGFAGSYVVDGDIAEIIRGPLGHGWRVTAVNYCYSRDIIWYELYDPDDGSYFGWVDSSFISFN